MAHFRGVHSFRSEIPVPIGGGHSAIHKKVAASDEPTAPAHEQRGDSSHLVWSTDAPSGGHLDHAPVPFATGPSEFILGERGHNDAGADRVDPCTPLAPTHRLGHHT